MKTVLLMVAVFGISVGGSLAVHHFPYNFLVTIPSSLLCGYAAFMEEAL